MFLSSLQQISTKHATWCVKTWKLLVSSPNVSKDNTISKIKYGGSSIKLWGYFCCRWDWYTSQWPVCRNSEPASHKDVFFVISKDVFVNFWPLEKNSLNKKKFNWFGRGDLMDSGKNRCVFYTLFLNSWFLLYLLGPYFAQATSLTFLDTT